MSDEEDMYSQDEVVCAQERDNYLLNSFSIFVSSIHNSLTDIFFYSFYSFSAVKAEDERTTPGTFKTYEI